MLVTRQPIGVSLMVTPWNFPLAMITRKVGPALAAGCTVVVKPASETPLTAVAFGALAAEAGIPAGVINVVSSSRSSATVAAMLNDPRVRKLSFTGSTEVGRRLLATAAETVTKCSMELGGNAPFIVFEDADLDTAVSAALTAKMRNGGESCTAANRFYVQRSVAGEFAERLAKEMSVLKLGRGDAEGVQVGPLINKDACDTIGELVAATIADGATLVTGGSAPEGPGHFFEPTVLADVPETATILSEEIFGPVAPVVAFDTEDEAVALANGTDLGLVAFVASENLSRCMRVAERIEAGMVGVNRGIVSDPAAPFGGWKQSGVGREGAHEGMLEYLETKYIAVDW
jgi:succinate-semialdehyde dehydrogenase/glutarate-semialdehyde dehydrogenase